MSYTLNESPQPRSLAIFPPSEADNKKKTSHTRLKQNYKENFFFTSKVFGNVNLIFKLFCTLFLLIGMN